MQSPAVPKPNLNSDEQLKAAQTRVVKLEAAIMATGDEDPVVACLKEALAVASCTRPDSTHWGFLGPIEEEDGGTERRSFQNPRSHGGVDNQNPGRNKSVGGFEGGSQGAAEPIHRANRHSRRDLFVASTDRTDGRFHGGGDVQEAKRVKICATTFPDVTPICRS